MPGKMEARQKIIDVAMSLVGSHYLWGSTGATPYVACGTPYWTEVVDPQTKEKTKQLTSVPVKVARPSLDPFSPCVNAAQCDADTPHVCAGRFRYHTVGGSIINDPSDKYLSVFLSRCQQVGGDVRYFNEDEPYSDSLFGPRLTPRVIVGKKITDRDAVTVISGRTVWGEDCTQKRHFDCLGFISYVLNQATKKYFNARQLWGGAIADYYNDNYHMSDEVSLADPPVPGDILFRGELNKNDPKQSTWHHIGFLAGNGKVVQAEMAVTGVHADTVYDHGQSWTARRRLTDAQLP